jgi:hypothetical protein
MRNVTTSLDFHCVIRKAKNITSILYMPDQVRENLNMCVNLCILVVLQICSPIKSVPQKQENIKKIKETETFRAHINSNT